jgi:pimeloyl-ACP methyl ester carboxylesterase
MEGMLNYYKANYPRDAREAALRSVAVGASPPIDCPVLLIHGLKDEYLLPGALNDTWAWVKRDLTLVTIPDAGHFVQQDAADLVTRTMRSWLFR